MGLDMYLFKVSKVDKYKVGQYINNLNELYAENIDYIEEEDFKNTINTIKHYAIMVRYKEPELNLLKIFKDYHFPKDSTFEIERQEGEVLPKKIILKNERLFLEYIIDVNEKFLKIYMYDKIKRVYIYKNEEVAYQRKGLNDTGWDLLMQCGNCNNCEDYTLIKAMVDEGDLNESFINNWSSGETYFTPWW